MLNEIIRRYEEDKEVVIENYDAIAAADMTGLNGVYADILAVKRFLSTEKDFIVDAIKRLSAVISENDNSEEVKNLFRWLSENPEKSIYEFSEATGIELSEEYRQNHLFSLYSALRNVYLQIMDRETAVIEKSVDKALILAMKAVA